MKRSRLLVLAGVVVVAVITLALALPGGAADFRVIRAQGPTVIYNPPNVTSGITTRVLAVVIDSSSSRTITVLEVSGFSSAEAGRTFGAHVHTKQCGTLPADSGPHYQNANGGPNLADREIWVDFTVNQFGRGRGVAVSDFAVPAKAANSIVIHESPTNPDTGAAGARLACTNVAF